MQGIFLLQKNVSVLANYVQTVLCYSNIIKGNVIPKTNNETEDFTMKRKMVSALLCATMVAGMVVVPAATAQAADKKLIGVTMPTKDLQRWNQDGDNMKKELEAAGYEVDLQYASNDVSTQVSQLENQVANGCDLLVVASIDGSSLGEPLKQAKEKGIPVISYDRLLMNSDAVTYYATFDNYKVGQKQGEYLVDALDLDNQDGPFNIELFTGDPGDLSLIHI